MKIKQFLTKVDIAYWVFIAIFIWDFIDTVIHKQKFNRAFMAMAILVTILKLTNGWRK